MARWYRSVPSGEGLAQLRFTRSVWPIANRLRDRASVRRSRYGALETALTCVQAIGYATGGALFRSLGRPCTHRDGATSAIEERRAGDRLTPSVSRGDGRMVQPVR